MTATENSRIGIALGSGSARGWAHIGILRGLEELGIVPAIVCGTSIGALVGAAYVSGRLSALEEWIVGLRRWDVLRLLDLSVSGLEGERLMKAFCERVSDVPIESLPKPFAAVATELNSGREIWLNKGSLLEAVRASIAIPGLLSPVRRDERWLADGGLVNPVPVSLCRALGAEHVIAVNLNGDIVGKHFLRRSRIPRPSTLLEGLGARLQAALGVDESNDQDSQPRDRRVLSEDTPNLLDFMSSAINVMQDRITRSRLAGDPPDITLSPRLAHLALIDFNRADEAIAAGKKCVERHRPVLKEVFGLT